MEFFTIAFSTFLGAAVALAAERLTKAHDARRQEEAAINNLILDLAAKRAFLVAEEWVWGEGELDRVVGSVHDARTLIRDARLDLRPRSWAMPHLRTMTMACNRFLEVQERGDQDQAKDALRDLSATLAAEVRALHSQRPGNIYPDAPGSFALARST
jgi:hypothetical protein